jgi:hypothetical protein
VAETEVLIRVTRMNGRSVGETPFLRGEVPGLGVFEASSLRELRDNAHERLQALAVERQVQSINPAKSHVNPRRDMYLPVMVDLEGGDHEEAG